MHVICFRTSSDRNLTREYREPLAILKDYPWLGTIPGLDPWLSYSEPGDAFIGSGFVIFHAARIAREGGIACGSA